MELEKIKQSIKNDFDKNKDLFLAFNSFLSFKKETERLENMRILKLKYNILKKQNDFIQEKLKPLKALEEL